MLRVDGGVSYARLSTASVDSDFDDSVAQHAVDPASPASRVVVDSAQDDDDEDEVGQLEDVDEDESGGGDVRSSAQRRNRTQLGVVVLVVALLAIAAVVSYEERLPLPALPDTVNHKVDEFRQMFWRSAAATTAYQPPPAPVALSSTPPAVAALHACQAAYQTTRALLLTLSGAVDEEFLGPLMLHAQSVYEDSKHGFCILAVSTTASSHAAASEQRQSKLVTHLTADQVRALPYTYVQAVQSASGAPLSVPFATTAGSLLLMHAGFDVIIDVQAPLPPAADNAERAKQITIVDYSASTYLVANDGPSEYRGLQHHCSAAVQLTSVSDALLSHYTPPNTPAALTALTSHELLVAEQSSLLSTTVFSPAFAGLYLPSSASSSGAAVNLRSLVYRTLLSFLWVPTRPSAFLARHGLTDTATITPSAVGAPADGGPAPALMRQSHINACVVRWIHSEKGSQAPSRAEDATASIEDEQLGDDEAVQLRQTVKVLTDAMLGHPSDAQQRMRQVLLAGDVEQGEVMRRSLEPDQLVQQIYSHLSQHTTGVVTAQDIRELQAFLNDQRNIALTLQQSHNRTSHSAVDPHATAAPSIPASASTSSGPLSLHGSIPPAVVVPRQSRTAVCIQFNYAPEEHSLHALLPYHARLHHHLMLSMPLRATELSASHRLLLSQFPDITFLYCASYRGYFQYRCLHQCLVHSHSAHVDSSGMLFVADDAWFNFTQSMVQWDKWLVDEFWYHSKGYLMDLSQPFSKYYGAFESQWFHEGRDYHIRLQRSYYSWPQRYRDALNSVYGEDFVATEALSDVLYVPRADSQMANLIEVLAEQMGQVDVWCEVMTAVLVDLAMILSGHRPNLPIFPAVSQQVAIFLAQKQYKDKDGVVRYIDGVQLDAEYNEHPQRFYHYMRRGATTITRAMQNDSGAAHDRVAASMTRFTARSKEFAYWWLDEMEQMRLQHRTADFYDPPQPVGACALHYSADGFIASSALRPVLLRPDGNVVLPHRRDVAFARQLVDGEATGWIHPIKMSERGGEFTVLGMESLNRQVVQMSGLLWQDEWWKRRTQCMGNERNESGNEAAT